MNKLPRFPLVAGAVAVAAAIAAGWWFNHPDSDAAQQSTDDAYVQADFTTIAPQIAGVVASLNVSDHQAVAAGAPLLSIDDRELRIAVESAKARIAASQAALDSLEAQLARQQSNITQSRAVLEADDANLTLADADRKRFTNLAKEGAGTLQAQQQAQAHWDTLRAGRERDQASARATEQQSAVLRADIERARADLQAAQAQKSAADLNLSYAHIAAPVAGVVAQRTARVGSYVRPGEPLLTLVPLDAVYVEANFRETQLAHLHVGQAVNLAVDALPGVQLHGHIESLAPASGVSFSAVPPHNATGNFTKIVQRLPVRIALDPGQKEAQKLRVGMSVRPTIDTRQSVALNADTAATQRN